MNELLSNIELENPAIQVVWTDYPENFTSERIRSIKSYFQKKYNSTNVNVITKTKSIEENENTVDVSINIMDKNYQKELIKTLLDQKNNGKYYDDILSIDNIVENKMLINNVEIVPFKKWYIKNIEFSNFLSYGNNQKIDFDKCNGITVIESDPSNFGGKSILSVDLLLFLFFNTTTRTQKSEDVFNRYTDENIVSVKGEIIIDGEEYIIARKVERKKSKSGEWNVKTELEFFKKLPNGEIQNFSGEQRRETENFIKESIGSMDDFMMTILTTGSNLEDLLEAKPTARGAVLSRFLGLEFLKKKEEAAKEVYSDFSKGMLSNVYNSESLKNDIATHKETIKKLEEQIKETEGKIENVTTRIQTGNEYKENLLTQKHLDIDKDLLIINPDDLNNKITQHENTINNFNNELNKLIINKPTEFYNEVEHDSIRDKILSNKTELGVAKSKVQDIKNLVQKYGNGVQCEHCGINLIDAAITKQKISELSSWEDKVNELSNIISELEKNDSQFIKLKKDFDEYEKNKLIKEKYELSIESEMAKKNKIQETLVKYNEVQDKIKKNKEIESQLVKANLRLDELMMEKRSYDKIIITNQSEIKTLGEKIEKNNELIYKIAEEFEKERVYSVYLDLFGKNGISKSIMKTMMPTINSELQRLLEDACYFTLEVRINDKNEVEFIMIDNSTGVERLMTTGSGYEKTIASLALRSVLSKVCSLPKPNIIVMDEVFGKISNDNLEMVGQFFVKIKDYFDKILVISHNPLINNWADNIIKVKKEDNISKVIQKN